MENYVGKVVKIKGVNQWKRPFEVVGIVYAQRPGYQGESTIFSLIRPNGVTTDSISVAHNGSATVSSTKIDPELRAALKEAYKAKVKLEAFKERYKQELAEMEKSFSGILSAVKDLSGEMSSTEFMDKLCALFDEKYPPSGGYYDSRRFDAGSWSETEVTMVHRQDVEKYARAEQYSFLYREYDDTTHIRYESEAYKNFCQRNAPAVIPELAKHCKTDVSASIGDKNWLSAQRHYTFPIKYGYSKRSLDEIKERLFGIRTKLPSVEEQIAQANGQRSIGGGSKLKEQGRDGFGSR